MGDGQTLKGEGGETVRENARPGVARHPSPNRVICFLCLLLSTLCFQARAIADGIAVHKTEVHYLDGGYQFSADFDIRFRFAAEQALEQGVALYFISEFILTRPRWYWLDEVVEQSEQSVKLSYNTLTRQYRVARGALFQNFASLDDALHIIGHLTTAPVAADPAGSGSYLSEKLLKKDGNYVAAVRLRLDETHLPKPLQVNALTSDDWNLDSGWYRWIVHLDAARGKGE